MKSDTIARLENELQRQRRLAEASYALHTTLDLGELLQIILRAASDGVDADRGTVFLISDDGDELWSRVMQGEEALEIRLPLGKGIAGAVGETGKTIRIDDAYEDQRFDQSWDKKTGFRTRQILAAPIRGRDGRTVGVFQLLNKNTGNFDDADEAFLDALSIHAALAVENARLHSSAIEKERQDREIALVQNVQRAFQPESTDQTIGTLAIAGLNVLCEDASGDYYDLIELKDGRVVVVIGDVSGHGMHSALVMAQARALLRAFCATMDDLALVVNLLNDFLSKDLTSGRFMTMFIVLFDPATGVMDWCSAGHPPTLLHRVGGDVERLLSTGRVLGVFPDGKFVLGEQRTLESGDTLLLYTDGATEANAPDGEMFEEERLSDVLRQSAGGGPRALLGSISEALLDWTKQPDMGDDLTMMAVRREP